MQERNKNAGVTLIELIVVIAILGVISGGILVSMGLGKWASAKGAADRIDSKMEQVKTLSMTKAEEQFLALYKKEDGYYVSYTKEIRPFTTDSSKEEKLGNNQMAIEVTFADGTTQSVEEANVYISFDRASGAILACQTAVDGGTPLKADLPKSIAVTAKGRTSTIKIIAQTGKHYMD